MGACALLAACPRPQAAAPGTLCSQGGECASGFCVDGVCCESACEGACFSCAVSGSEGLCAPVPDGRDLRHACAAGICGGACDGQGACRYPGAEKSCGERVCAADSVQRAACDGKGACGLLLAPCAPYACRSGACLSRCSVPAECAASASCRSGACEAELPSGSLCGSGAACASGYCADGVCCDRPCGGRCESCLLAGKEGSCSPIPAGQDPQAECGPGGTCGASCDGAGACAYVPVGTPCRWPWCASRDSALVTRACDGAGGCPETQASCGAYACLSGSCATSCGTDAECRSSAFCQGGLCVPRRAQGDACASGNECQSGLCVDGLCCSSACSGPCDSCNGSVPGSCSPAGPGGTPAPSCAPGQACGQTASCPSACGPAAPCAAGYYCGAGGGCAARKVSGNPCGAGAECVAAFCADGLCCESDCQGTPCRSCDFPGYLGLCLPHAWGFPGSCPGAYACRADGLCASGPCGDDRDCKASAYCAGASGCLPLKAQGASCARTRECAAGLDCVDGFCCNSTCAGSCRACNLGGAAGSCSFIQAGQDPFGECPGGLACDGTGACHASCIGAAQCESGFLCQLGACIPGKALGVGCADAGECASTFCIDGVCCDRPCSGACRSCIVAGRSGACSASPAGTDPEGDCAGGLACTGLLPDGGSGCRTACAIASDCEMGFGCADGGCIALRATGAVCDGGVQCQSGFCADGVCCSALCDRPCEACNFDPGLGACLPVPAGTDPASECGGNLCNGLSACGAPCATDSQCGVSGFCNLGACAPKRAVGQFCYASNQCTSGYCADGVCCGSSCAGPCEACDLPGAAGSCSPIAAGTDSSSECQGGLSCNGARACNATCATQAECEAPFHCRSGSCVPDQAVGASCGAGDECVSGFCADGRCCDGPCSGRCQSCNLSGREGRCSGYPGGTDPEAECPLTFCTASFSCLSPCTSDASCEATAYCDFSPPLAACRQKRADGSPCQRAAECASGYCVDGVCCTSSCAGPCQACDASGSCGSVASGTDPEGECGLAYCAGAGGCASPCGSDADCKIGNRCDLGAQPPACLAKAPIGVACSSAGQCASGLCVDGRCCNAVCGGQCDSCDLAGFQGLCTNLSLSDGRTGSPSCSPYLCRGTSTCPGSCLVQAHCVAGSYCDSSGSCRPKKADGLSCAAAVECLSGACADGVCCASGCTGECRRCQAGSGLCESSARGTDPANECGGYVCDGSGACFSGCSGTGAECKASHYCTGSSCAPKKPKGSACSSAVECTSGHCVDGYCCDGACTGSCEVCDSTPGSCTRLPAGAWGAPSCAPYVCGGTSGSCRSSCAVDSHCAPAAHCSGLACVGDLPFGSRCLRASQCQSGNCTDGVCCASAACSGACRTCDGQVPGSCSAARPGTDPHGDCGSYTCDVNGSCRNSCAFDSDCKAPARCQGGACG